MSKKIVLTCICCLNSFLNDIDKFKDTGNEYILPQQIYDEFQRQNDVKLYKKMIYCKRHKLIKIYDMQILTDEHKTYKSILNGQLGQCYGKCESSAISIAIHNNALLLTDNNENIINKIGNYTLEWLNINDLKLS